MVNIYGPYSDRASFWEDLVSVDICSDHFLVVGEYLNLNLSLWKGWGAHPMVEKKSGFFLSLIERAILVDIEHVKLSPTWINLKIGD